MLALSGDPDAAAIVGAVVDLGRRLGKRIVAEGVETEQQYHTLASLGCHVGQGFWMSRPVDGEQLARWVRAWQPPLQVTGPTALPPVTPLALRRPSPAR